MTRRSIDLCFFQGRWRLSVSIICPFSLSLKTQKYIYYNCGTSGILHQSTTAIKLRRHTLIVVSVLQSPSIPILPYYKFEITLSTHLRLFASTSPFFLGLLIATLKAVQSAPILGTLALAQGQILSILFSKIRILSNPKGQRPNFVINQQHWYDNRNIHPNTKNFRSVIYTEY